MQALQAQAVEIITVAFQIRIVVLPGFHGIIRNTGGKQDCLPKLFNSLVLGQTGEHFLCPGSAGNGSNTPLLLILPTILISFQNREAEFSGSRNLLHIHALQTVRILTHQI